MKHSLSVSVGRMLALVAFTLPACQGGAGGSSSSGGASGELTSASGGEGSGGDLGGRDAGVGESHSGGAGGSSIGGGSAGGTSAGSQGTGGAGTWTSGATSPKGGSQGSGTRSSVGGSQAAGTAGSGGGAAGLTIYYIRHAEVVANTLDPSQVTLENADVLTELGLRQAEALSTYLQGMGVTPDAILVSPHLRAQRTIKPYLSATGLPGEVWMELAEASDKAATGAPVPSEPKYIKYYKATLELPNLTFRDPARVEFWQNDSYESGLLMVMTARDLLLERYSQSGKTILVVGHAIAGQLLIGLLRGESLLNGPPTTGSGAVYLLNTGVMWLTQDSSTGLFKLDGRNINNPATK